MPFNKHSECLLLGRTLAVSDNEWDDRARVCGRWKQRPDKWIIYCTKNPHWDDVYVSRETLINLRTKYKIDNLTKEAVK
jgi:hypothetical protein